MTKMDVTQTNLARDRHRIYGMELGARAISSLHSLGDTLQILRHNCKEEARFQR